MRDYAELSDKLVNWIRKQVKDAGCKGAVVGLSGGIDSAVTAVLCKKAFPDTTLGLILPCHSNLEDAVDAKLVAEKFDIEYKVVDLDETFDVLLSELRDTQNSKGKNELATANIKPRLRMTALYYYSASLNRLVVGTDNRSELKIGYFTKHGDGGVDIAPLGNLVKTEVRELAAYLGIPEKIIERPPTAGLWADQTDEKELGITYEELDHYILTGEADLKVKEKIEELAKKNAHKLGYPPVPEF
ncbi:MULTISPECIES: NAD(+) synthase [unclassified Candidatus Frackibacter]|uniref:NAD(+) synthase n=1 Tax=unclassified Candidatus Frackibacter TaxID=2648818 RepID=UPI00087F2EA1|nr:MULTISPECIES: NAD(+) synthase [unclassified Candidatus Frackibacter]SDC11536.1 NAD+ synthase [Candidatus Frackibacter sp. WG11]SEM36420.1 NAD+ synthase [Candidatus Frackibacter sp. WG12]SFL41679.1 NAD+ synthase [Candidatus Frackibacter sp. WG13]